MNRYANIDCPICAKPLKDNDTIVVCPECGAPYHLECYKEKGQCIFDELHKNNEDWQPPEVEEKFDGKASLRCSRCGTINPPHGIFCQVCGNQLANQNTTTPPNNQVPPNMNGGFMGGFYPPTGMPLNPFTTPFGGVAPDDDIDDIPAKEIAIFVGNNSHYFLPKFKQLSNTKGKAKSVNWSAFLFTGGYYLYRKMYGIGIVLLILQLLLAIPNTIMLASSLYSPMVLDLPFDMGMIATVNFITSLISWALRLACAFLTNSIYKKHVFKKIKKIKATTEGQGEEQYLATLRKKGSVAIKLILGLIIAYFTLSILSFFLLTLLGY